MRRARAAMELRTFICLSLLANLRVSSGQILGCPEGQWQCDDGHCITDTWRCDGEGDCLDGSDEMDCDVSQGSDCPAGQFPCLDSVGCVDMSARCDGKYQCPTGSDEENCPAIEGCLDSDWMCKNRICVPKSVRCNMQNDCGDNSDEEDCDMCDADGARCLDGTCLSPAERCDGEIDCSDGSDEPMTCGRICSMNNGGCSHVCTDEPWGALCACPVGYKLSSNGLVCEDLDECASPFPPCMHRCTNTIGSYHCSCREGFKLTERSECLVSGKGTQLLMVQKNMMGLLNVKSQEFNIIKTSVFDPVAFTFDIIRGWFYWADSRGNIYKSNEDHSWKTFSGEPGIKGLACDWLNGYLFWTSQKAESIYMQSADGMDYTTLLNKNVRPSELVLLPIESLMIWMNDGPGDRVTLEKSWMDGSDRSTLTVITAQFAHSLTADVAARRLYWISNTKRSIETVKVDGTGRHSFTGIFNRRLALSLAVFENMFYWVDNKGLWQVPLKQPGRKKFLWKTELPLLAVYHELQQPKGSSVCVNMPCRLCQLTKSNPVGFVCACPYLKVLLPDGTCEYPRFLYATMTTINLLEFQGRESTETQLFTTDEGILSFDLDWYRDWLYWANRTGHLQRTSLTQDKVEFIQTPLPVCLINVDQRTANIYWVSCDQKIIGTTMTGSNYPQQLYRTTKEIRSFYLDWLRGGMFWLEEERIFSMDMMEGKAKELLQMAGGVSGDIAFDLRAGSLLWNSKRAGLTALSLLKERSHQAGRWNVSGSVVAAFEPFLLSISDDVMTLWDRRDGSKIQSVTVKGHVLGVINVLGDIQIEPDTPVCNVPSMLCQSSSICIPQVQICDGKRDCPEGDDEEFCVATCSSKEFKCKDNRRCIPRNLVCDGRSHCHDGSDEVGCPTEAAPVTPATVLKCRSGSVLCEDGTECVLYSHVCDGETDCKDGSDEVGCDGPQEITNSEPPTQTLVACHSPSVLCPSSANICISPSQFCNDIKDCPDGFDEKSCVKSCPSKTDFHCTDRRNCVPKSLVCDGISHCHDGSDEVDCPNAPQRNMKCRFGSRLCRDGTACVLFSHICDGERDCQDGSDEEGCGENLSQSGPEEMTTIMPYTTPPCTSPSVLCPGSSICIKPTQMCDGRRDCPDASDEKCVQKCPQTDFRCKDRLRCVPKSQVCDGRSHCNDGSDEVNCQSVAPAPESQTKVLKCRFGSRLCKDRTACVPLSHICDGERDCQDGSDEEGCDDAENVPGTSVQNEDLTLPPAPTEESTQPPTTPPCTSPSVLCPGSSICIKPTQLCDGRTDCPDGFDEKCVKRCPSQTDFLCKDRRSCVLKSQVCDGRSHCNDGSDEVNCQSAAPPETQTKVLKCRFGSRLCQDGTGCVLLSHVCDGEKDCQDGSDEEECDVPVTNPLEKDYPNESPDSFKLFTEPPTSPPCTSPSVLCPGSSTCIKPTQMCDGRRDCPDGFDEKCVRRCPSKTDFRCKDRRSCVRSSQVCDGRSHCNDGSDELNCARVPPESPTKVLKCRFGSKLCRDGTACVLLNHICDGERDCLDGSDEEECDDAESNLVISEEDEYRNESPIFPEELTQPPTTPPCTSPSVLCPGTSICIMPTQFCDGRRNCPDGFDEKCVRRCPSRSDFRCKDRRSCVPKSQVCDGRSHCNDGSDEADCPGVALPAAPVNVLKCRMGSKLCRDGTECVLFSHVCDGERDCQDGSDEEGCDSTETSSESPSLSQPSCSFPSVQCPDSFVCINPSQLCDGIRDCPDGSDENCVKKCADRTDFLCKDRRSCVSRRLVCDGRAHCYDGSDEANCQRVSAPAPANVLKCRMGSRLCNDGKECVLFSHVCDGEIDCLDGSDEQGCQETCKEGQFQCAHGKMCIPESEVCDGKPQCRDQSDERDCWEQTKSCEHRCADGKRCIPKKFICDGEQDCLDGSDEVGCDFSLATTMFPPITSTPACVTPSVLCPVSSKCVSQNQLCDGQMDCPDGFDEKDCVVQCENSDDFLCSDQRKCIPRNQVCDGRAHCPDGSDEKECQSATSTTAPNLRSGPLKCRTGFKLCKDGMECVMYSHVCDGEPDCQDGSDEEGCESRCKADEFQCSHGKKCVPQEQVCDGRNDCQDGSDEKSCSVPSEGCHLRCDNKTRCVPQTFLCDGESDCADGSDEENCGSVACAKNQYRCASGHCVSEAFKCDGYPDCRDHSDEMYCPRPPRCPPELRCPNSHECLQKEWLCDGEEDCKDGSDEKNCNSPPAKCRKYQFQCGDSSQCIPLSWRCDGKEDCSNGIDEDKCSHRKCPFHLYQCGSKECLEPRLVCNGLTNCADGSDEGVGCAQRNCSSPSSPMCDHSCVSTPNGPRCFCGAGFRLQSSSKSCVDVDECSSTPGASCKQICQNTRGAYNCLCHPGFYLEPDNKSCKSKDEPLLLASVQSELLILGLHRETLQLLSSVNRPVFSLDYDLAQQRVYWLSPDYQSIRWADMKTSNKGTVIKGVKPDSIAVDWVGKNLYWVDGLVGQILAVKLSNTMMRSQEFTVVLGENLEQPSSLVLLPNKGLMLWSEIGSIPQIERSGMDGSQRKVVVSHDLSWPVSLAYDFLDNRVYWADEKLRCIGSASLDGDNIEILQLAETPSPFSVAVFNDRVFWSDTKRRTIRSADKRTGKDQNVLLKKPGQPFGLKLMHAFSQPVVSNPCEQMRCSHLCILAPENTAVCRCPKGLLLSQDKITCSLPKESSFILFLSHDMVYQVYLCSMHRDGIALKKMPNGRDFALPGITEALGLDFSVSQLLLYVAHSKHGSVDVLKLSSSRSRPKLVLAGQILKLQGEDAVTALAVDWVTSNLYWSSKVKPDIHVTSPSDGYTTSLLQRSLVGIATIALHPPSGRLCYTAMVITGAKSQTEVNCAWMDGRNKVVLWKKLSIPISLVFSNDGTRIYWADTGEGVISSIGVDGSGYKEYKTGPNLLVSFTFIENVFFWVTLEKDIRKLWFSDGLQPKQLWFQTKTNVVEIRSYNNDSQSGINSCSPKNGECAHLCLPYPGGHTCKCGRGFYSANGTFCNPLPSCPTGEESCFDGSECVSSNKFCDGRVDCPDQSDEQDCPNLDSASSRTKISDDQSSQSFSLHPDTQNSVLSDKDSDSCNLKHCNGHGSCITDGKATRCRCLPGYKGEFCEEQSRRSHPAVIMVAFCLVAAVIVAVFVFSKRKGWKYFSRSAEKETLMDHMVLPEQDSDSEELESPVDVKNPLQPLKSVQLE
ncbi:low-density lipoprotein receptor-related protein 2 isoform X2 [Kryptolebias marmoratus]|uniref:low-density lipoprotein receptor-related protein 2 isoform X2 n=1 Tax=Kryptolebias marmoratus TaxID=37003 RepID=UPI000D52FB15|nr:low-density lipoprotein receptor-related protein 2 isoform X2 [Kryptolebias marmoratus]